MEDLDSPTKAGECAAHAPPRDPPTAVVIGCTDNYVPFAIVALLRFTDLNPYSRPFVLGTKFSEASKQLLSHYSIGVHEIDLADQFSGRLPYNGTLYPAECFYHLYAYKLFVGEYEYVVAIEPDVFCLRPLCPDVLRKVAVTGGMGTRAHLLRNMQLINRDVCSRPDYFRTQDLDRPRVMPGLKVYNVQGCSGACLYEKAVELFADSRKMGVVRNGDDTLYGVYQVQFPEQITLLPRNILVLTTCTGDMSNRTPGRWCDDFKEYVLIHFVRKYWLPAKCDAHPLYTYAVVQAVDYIHERFPPQFIAQHFPHLDVADTRVPVYFYGAVKNFGDFITPYMLSKSSAAAVNGGEGEYRYLADAEANKGRGPRVISCGSIMRLSNERALIYGSGIRDRKQSFVPGCVLFVRGPLTRMRVKELKRNCLALYGDPGLLLPRIYNPSHIQASYELGIVPHVVDAARVRPAYEGQPGVLVIDLATDDVESVIDRMLSCRRIVSSSLHGLIVADAYGIPSAWIQFSGRIKGDGTKFLDYLQSVGRSATQPIDATSRMYSCAELVDLVVPDAAVWDGEELARAMFCDERGIKPSCKFLYRSLRGTDGTSSWSEPVAPAIEAPTGNE